MQVLFLIIGLVFEKIDLEIITGSQSPDHIDAHPVRVTHRRDI